MAMLRICFTKDCGIKTLGRLCLDCENATAATPEATHTLTAGVARELAATA